MFLPITNIMADRRAGQAQAGPAFLVADRARSVPLCLTACLTSALGHKRTWGVHIGYPLYPESGHQPDIAPCPAKCQLV